MTPSCGPRWGARSPATSAVLAGGESDIESEREAPMVRTMPLTVEQIVQETNQWPVDSVAELLDRITVAKHGGLAEQRGAAWAEVAARRSAQIDSGVERLIPGSEVSAQIRKLIGR